MLVPYTIPKRRYGVAQADDKWWQIISGTHYAICSKFIVIRKLSLERRNTINYRRYVTFTHAVEGKVFRNTFKAFLFPLKEKFVCILQTNLDGTYHRITISLIGVLANYQIYTIYLWFIDFYLYFLEYLINCGRQQCILSKGIKRRNAIIVDNTRLILIHTNCHRNYYFIFCN